jgi:hypothetical protein
MQIQTLEYPVAKAIGGVHEMIGAIDEVISRARQRIRIFDRDLADCGFNTADRFNRLKVFVLGNRTNRIEIVVHNQEYIERDCPRLQTLLRQFPYAIAVHRTLPEAQRVQDGFVIADGQNLFHRFHRDHPRGKLSLADESEGSLYQRRFDEIWSYSEPALSATVLGL